MSIPECTHCGIPMQGYYLESLHGPDVGKRSVCMNCGKTSEREHYFTCPQCGGHHFGRDITSDLDGADTVQCHNRVDGQPFIDDLKDWIDAGKPRQKACGWRGVWPVKETSE